MTDELIIVLAFIPNILQIFGILWYLYVHIRVVKYIELYCGFPLNFISISWFCINSDETSCPIKGSAMNLVMVGCVDCMIGENTSK